MNDGPHQLKFLTQGIGKMFIYSVADASAHGSARTANFEFVIKDGYLAVARPLTFAQSCHAQHAVKNETVGRFPSFVRHKQGMTYGQGSGQRLHPMNVVKPREGVEAVANAPRSRWPSRDRTAMV